MSDSPVQSDVTGGASPRRLLYSLDDAAKWIGVISRRQLAEKLRAREIEGYQFGRTWFLSEANILAFVESCRRPARPKPASGGGSKASDTSTPRRSKNRSPDASQGQCSLFDDGDNSDD